MFLEFEDYDSKVSHRHEYCSYINNETMLYNFPNEHQAILFLKKCEDVNYPIKIVFSYLFGNYNADFICFLDFNATYLQHRYVFQMNHLGSLLSTEDPKQ